MCKQKAQPLLIGLWIRNCNEQDGMAPPLPEAGSHETEQGGPVRPLPSCPNCHEDLRPYQKTSEYVCSETQWQGMSYWLAGDPTFLNKIDNRRRELREKIAGACWYRKLLIHCPFP